MSGLGSLAAIFACIAAGMAAAALKLLPRGVLAARLKNACLFALLFFMGFLIGRTEEVGRNLASIGRLAVLFTLAAVAGTAAALGLFYFLTDRLRRASPAVPPAAAAGPAFSAPAPRGRQLGEPLKLLAMVLAGFGTGLVPGLLPGFSGEGLTDWLLYGLVFFIGAELVGSGVKVARILAHPETLLLPALSAAGTLLGAGLLSPAVGLSTPKALAVSAGFGWYSLSGVLITDLGDPVLGSVAFMSNIMRETFALLTIPLIARTRFPRICIGIAGATSMDVTLPLIEKSCGPEAVPLAVASGAILSLLVPFLVPLLYGLG